MFELKQGRTQFTVFVVIFSLFSSGLCVMGLISQFPYSVLLKSHFLLDIRRPVILYTLWLLRKPGNLQKLFFFCNFKLSLQSQIMVTGNMFMFNSMLTFAVNILV